MEQAFRSASPSTRTRQTVFLSSHILSEVEALCDRVGILREGELVEIGTLAEMRHLVGVVDRGRVRQHPARPVGGSRRVTSVEVAGNRVRCQVVGSIEPLLGVLAAAGVHQLLSREPSLEELFLAHYGTPARRRELTRCRPERSYGDRRAASVIALITRQAGDPRRGALSGASCSARTLPSRQPRTARLPDPRGAGAARAVDGDATSAWRRSVGPRSPDRHRGGLHVVAHRRAEHHRRDLGSDDELRDCCAARRTTAVGSCCCRARRRRAPTAEALLGLAAGLVAMFALTALLTAAERARCRARTSRRVVAVLRAGAVSGAAMFVAIGASAGQLALVAARPRCIAAAVFGAFLVRMVADSGTSLEWLRWASPLGWVEELLPLIGTRPLALLPISGLVVISVAGAIVVAGRRDLGASVLASRDSAAPRTGLLGGPWGITIRLGRPVALGWIAGLAVLGLVMGLVAQSASTAISGSKTIEQAIARLGGYHGGAASYLGLAFLIAAALVAFAAAAQISATRSEEADGYLDHLLVRPVARDTWLGGRLAFGAVLVVVASFTAGVAAWIGAATQHSDLGLSAMLQAGLNIAAPPCSSSVSAD